MLKYLKILQHNIQFHTVIISHSHFIKKSYEETLLPLVSSYNLENNMSSFISFSKKKKT